MPANSLRRTPVLPLHGRRRSAPLALAVGLAFASPAFAQSADPAGDLFTLGMTKMDAGDYKVACKAFAESHRLAPTPGKLFTLAVCETRWGHIATAVTRYGEFLKVYEGLPPDKQPKQAERAAEAKKQIAELGPQIPKLTLVLPPGAPAGAAVMVDGEPIADASIGTAIAVDPGEHRITTQAPGAAATEQTVTLDKSETKSVTLEIKGKPSPAPSPVNPAPSGSGEPSNAAPPPGPVGFDFPTQATGAPSATSPSSPRSDSAPTTSTQRSAAYVVGAVGLAGLAAGAILGGVTAATKGDITDHCGSAVGSSDETACDPTGMDAAKSAKSTAFGSSIGFGVGAAGLVTAIVLFATAPSTPNASAAARGPWITADVLTAGPNGAVVGARGSF